MLAMRLATAADIPAVHVMIVARCVWLEDHGWPSWRDSAASVAGQAENTHQAMWLLEDDGMRIVGCTTVLDSGPPWGWTAEELAEPASYLYTTVTDPAYRAGKPGTLIALWAVNRAAEDGRRWVRRGCTFSRLAAYYARQGFSVVREVPRSHATYTMMSRRAEPVADLDRRFASSASATI